MRSTIFIGFIIFCISSLFAAPVLDKRTPENKRLLAAIKYYEENDSRNEPEEIKLSDSFRMKLTKIVIGGAASPVISGDGKIVLWNQYFPERELTAVMMLKDGTIKQLSSDNYPAMWPAPSNDASVVAWTACPRGTKSDWDIERWEGGATRVVAGSEKNEFYHSISADGKTIVYDRDQNSDFGVFDIYAIRNGASGYPEAISADPRKNESFPWITPDGKRIFWRELRKINGKSAQEFFRFEGGKIISTFEDGNNKYSPSTNFDGSLLLFASNVVDQGGIYLMKNLDPNSIKDVAEDIGTLQWYSSMSSDGSTWAWADMKDMDEGFNIWVHRNGIDAPVTQNTATLFAQPTLSNDGKSMTFVDYRVKNQYVVYRIDFLD